MNDLEHIGINTEEPSFSSRLKILFRGAAHPRDSREYKEAMIELQRLLAPLLAILLPWLFVLVLLFMPNPNLLEERSETVNIVSFDPVEPLDEIQPIPDMAEATHEPAPQVDVPSSPHELPSAAPETATPQAGAPMPLALSKAPIMKGISGLRSLDKEIIGSGGANLGYRSQIQGDMIGTLYDFKRTPGGDPRTPNYWTDLKYILDNKLTKKAFADFYKVKRQVFLSHLFVPTAPAETGPTAFGVNGLMEARQWIAHYTGIVQPRKSGYYRFAGHFDDAIVVLIDGRVVMESTWPYQNTKSPISGWMPHDNVGAYRCFSGQTIVYGDWIRFESDKPSRIDLLVGEHPGGLIGGVLMIQDKSATYSTDANGRPILPIFATSLLSPQERRALEDFKSFKFDMVVPIMNTHGRKQDDLTQKDDIKVDSNL